jgi:DNA-binding transcriptional MerR regulator
MKLIMQGKRFGFSLEEIRQLLNLYNFGDHRTRQIKQTYQLGLTRLSSMEQQKKELGIAIKDLKTQLQLCKDLLLKRGADAEDL